MDTRIECLHTYPSGTKRTADMSPTGEWAACLRSPVGAYVGKTRVWYFCDQHVRDVLNTITEHASTSEFPIRKMTVETAQVWEVMET